MKKDDSRKKTHLAKVSAGPGDSVHAELYVRGGEALEKLRVTVKAEFGDKALARLDEEMGPSLGFVMNITAGRHTAQIADMVENLCEIVDFNSKNPAQMKNAVRDGDMARGIATMLMMKSVPFHEQVMSHSVMEKDKSPVLSERLAQYWEKNPPVHTKDIAVMRAVKAMESRGRQ